jgi:YaiO family outer membrane protein
VRILYLIIIAFLVGMGLQTARAQKLNADSLFEKARANAFDGQREKARELCRLILSQKPDYHDVRVLMARTYAWDRQYKEAREELKKVLTRKPGSHDAINALIDVEFWAQNYLETIAVCDSGLALFPGDEEYLLKKAKALEKLELYEEALAVLDLIIKGPPASADGSITSGEPGPPHKEPNAEAIKMAGRIKLAMIRNEAGINYSLDAFDEIYGPRHLVYSELKRRTKIGTVIGRANYANRFERSGFQYEVDAYPKISKGMYAYLNFGVSGSSLFPAFRTGAEYHTKLKRGFEASIGMRYLAFTNNKIAIYTGSIGKYYKDYWFSFRPFITPKGNGVSNSFNIFIRRYLRDANNYVTFIAGTGFSPEDRNNFTAETYTLRSQKAGLEYNQMFKGRFTFRIGIMLERQELSFRPGDFVMAYGLDTGLRYRFGKK